MVVCDDKNGGCDGGEQSVAQGDDDYLLPPTNTQRFTVTAETPLRVKRKNAPAGGGYWIGVVMIHPQVHLRIPCYDFTFL